MQRALLPVCLIGAAFLVATPSVAQEKKPTPASTAGAGAHPASSYYRRAPQVRGFVQRRGGYSYGRSDVINTYSDNRVQFGSNNSYRSPYVDLQSRSGPFDHGFFFDSGVSARGGNSPYHN